MERILVVDDEEPIAQLIAYNLRKAGLEAVIVGNGEEALVLSRTTSFDLIILDVMLPGINGFEVCQEIRKKQEVPILMLTARGEEIDRIVGFDLGADDYVTKPFSPAELVRRVQAILRRTRKPLDAEHTEANDLEFGPLRLNFVTHEVTKAGQPIDLTPTEFQLLRLLAKHPGRVFSRDELITHIMGADFYGDVRTIDVHVHHLRAKVEDNPTEPKWIQTIRGAGYKFIGARRQ